MRRGRERRAGRVGVGRQRRGYVVSVAVRDNQAVRPGDILFRIDDRDYRAKLAQAEANVKAAQARLANSGEDIRSEEHTSELQSLMRISYAVFCLKKKK